MRMPGRFPQTRAVVRMLPALAAMGILTSHALALEVVLHNRKRFVGDVKMSPKTVSVKVPGTTYNIPRGSVKAINLFGDEVLEFEKRRAALTDAAASHVALAKWLEDRFQHEEATKHYESALEFDPNDAKARHALGHRKEKGEWVRDPLEWLRIRSDWLGSAGAEACCGLARHEIQNGRHEDAKEWLRRALIADPECVEALKLLRPITDKYVVKNTYRLPLEGLWAVVVDPTGHHKREAYMVYALDFVKVDDDFKMSRVPNSRDLADYYTFGALIHAAADGEVYSINEGFDDLPLGRWGEFRSANTVCIRHANGEYTVYGHLQKGSIAVKNGQKVKAGQAIARAGNSGSSGYPHLHFAMYDRDGISYPVTFFDYAEVTRHISVLIESGRLSEGKFYCSEFKDAADAKTP